MKKESNAKYEGTELHNTRDEITFKSVALEWLQHKAGAVKESTLAQCRSIVHTTIKYVWANSQLNNYNGDLLCIISEELHNKYKLRTAKLYIITINQVLKYAYDRGYTSDLLNISAKTKTCKVSRPQVFSVMEQKMLTEYLIADLDLNKLGVLVCLYSGLRLGEICGLKWGDIDLKKEIIKISRTVQRVCDGNGGTYMLMGAPKSEFSEREVPIPSFLNDILLNYCSDKECYVTTGTTDHTQPRTYQNIVKRYYRECKISQYHFHTLRHTFASRAIELGFDPKSLSEILGHSSVRITLDLYVHPSMEAKKKEMERFSEFIKLT